MLPVLFCKLNLKEKIGKNICCCCFQLGKLNDHLFGEELLRLYACPESVCLICVSRSFSFGIEGRMWDVIVLIPNLYLSIYFVLFTASC